VADAVPVLIDMVVEGANDVEAAEVLGALARAPARGQEILKALVEQLTAHSGNSPVRIRLAQALVEQPEAGAMATLRGLAEDEDHAVALVAAALVQVHGQRRRQDPS
jgi:HEAT repeat protein